MGSLSVGTSASAGAALAASMLSSVDAMLHYQIKLLDPDRGCTPGLGRLILLQRIARLAAHQRSKEVVATMFCGSDAEAGRCNCSASLASMAAVPAAGASDAATGASSIVGGPTVRLNNGLDMRERKRSEDEMPLA